MRRYLFAGIIGIMIGQYPTVLVLGDSHRELKFNHEFYPFVATEQLNTQYRSTLLFSDSVRKIYFIQSVPEKPQWYPDDNTLGVCYGEKDLSDMTFMPNPPPLTPRDTTPLKLVYPFYPPGCDMEVQNHHTTSRECAIHILPGETYTVLYLDQRFSAGGTGGHHDGIVRTYLLITQEHLYLTTDDHVITYFYLGYPRDYGSRDTWRPGYMGYSHCYDMTVSLQNDHLIITCMKQEFQIENLFETPKMVEHSEHKAPNGWWGESFTYKEFSVPREPTYTYIQETKTFPLDVVE